MALNFGKRVNRLDFGGGTPKSLSPFAVAAKSVLPSFFPGGSPQLLEKAERNRIVSALNVPQQALFKFSERPELGLKSAAIRGFKGAAGFEKRLTGRDLLKTRGVDLDKRPSLAGEFAAAGLDVLADPLFVAPTAVRGVKKLAGRGLADKFLKGQFLKKVWKNPQSRKIIESIASGKGLVRQGETLSLEPAYKKFKNTLRQIGVLDAIEQKLGGRVITETIKGVKVPRGALFSGIPFPSINVPKDIISKFSLTAAQVANIQAGKFAGLAPGLVSELGKVGIVAPTKAPKIPRAVEQLGKPLPPSKVAPLVRLQTGQSVPVKPTLKEPQALRRLFKREEQVAREAGRAGKLQERAAQEERIRTIKQRIAEARTQEEKRNLSIKLRAEERGAKVAARVTKAASKEELKTRLRDAKTESERVGLRVKLGAAEKASKLAARFTKRETKETLRLIDRIKQGPIEGMSFEEKEIINGLGNAAKKAKTLQELRTIYGQIQQAKAIGKEKFIQTKARKDAQFKADKSVVLGSMNISPGAGVPKGPRGIAATQLPLKKQVPKVLRAATLRPQRIFDALDGGQNFEGANSKFFANRANQAEDVKLRAINARTDALTAKMKEIGMGQQQLLSTRPVDGIPFTVDEMLSIYTGARNTAKTLAIVYGNKIPFSTMRNVIAQMTPQEKALGEAIVADYEQNYPRLRKSFIDYTDGKTDLGKVKGGYTPIRRTLNGYMPTENELASELTQRVNLRKAFTQRGFTKERMKVPKEFQQPIKLGEMNLWLEQMPKQEHFMAYGDTVKEMQRMVTDKDFTASVEKKLGQPFVDTIKNWVNRVANPSIYKASSQLEKTGATLRQNVAIAYLGLNFVTMLKQAPSLALFLSDVSTPELISGIYDFTANHKESTKLIHRLSPQMKNRSIERELEELKRISPNKYAELIRKFGRKSMLGIYGMDKVVTHSGWLAIFNKFSRAGLSEVEAADKATRAVLRTQPAAHAKDLAEIYTTNEFANWFTQFTNQLNQIYNIVTYDIPSKFRAGKTREGLRSAMGVALSAYLIAWMSKGSPPDTAKELKDAGIESGLNYIPVVGRGMASLRKGFGFSSIPALAGFEAAGKTLIALEKGKKEKAIESGIETAATLGGVPFSQPRRFLKGAAALASGKTKDLRRLIFSERTLGVKKKKSKKSKKKRRLVF